MHPLPWYLHETGRHSCLETPLKPAGNAVLVVQVNYACLYNTKNICSKKT